MGHGGTHEALVSIPSSLTCFMSPVGSKCHPPAGWSYPYPGRSALVSAGPGWGARWCLSQVACPDHSQPQHMSHKRSVIGMFQFLLSVKEPEKKI